MQNTSSAAFVIGILRANNNYKQILAYNRNKGLLGMKTDKMAHQGLHFLLKHKQYSY